MKNRKEITGQDVSLVVMVYFILGLGVGFSIAMVLK